MTMTKLHKPFIAMHVIFCGTSGDYVQWWV